MSAAVANVLCGVCGVSAYPSMIMDEKYAVVPSCPSCGAAHRDFQVSDMTQEPTKLAKVLPIRETQITNVALPAPTDVIGMIRNRLTFLDVELAKLAGYSAERKALQRMLQAADKILK